MAERELRFEISSDPDRFRDARAFLLEAARLAGLDEACLHDVVVALSEACSNAYRHGYAGRTDGRIELHVAWDEERFTVRVRDWGERFDPRAVAAPDLDEPREGGYGVFLMRNLMDELRYRDAGDGMELVMTKLRPAARMAK